MALDAVPSGDVTVTPSSGDTSAVTVSGALTFSTTTWGTAQTVTVSAIEDSDSTSETVTVSNAVSGANYSSVTAASVTVNVADNDTPGVRVSPTSLTVNEGSTDGAYAVELNTQPSGQVTVVITSDNTDVTASESTLTFTTGNWDTAQTVTVTAAQDADGANDSATLTHDPSGGDYDSAENTDLEVTVTDDETADITVSPTSVTVDEDATAEYTVALDTQPVGGSVTVTIVDPTDNGDVTTSPERLTFSASNWATARTVTVSAAQDNDTVNDSATVTHTVSGGDYASVTADDVDVTVTDTSVRGITASPASFAVTEAAGVNHTDTYTVALDTDPTATVEVAISERHGDVTTSPTTLTFTSGSTGNWNTPQTVTVTAVDDLADEGDIDPAVTLMHIASGGDYGANSVTLDFDGSVTDNDVRGVTFSPMEVTVTEGDTATYTLVLHTQPLYSVDDVVVTVIPPEENKDVDISPDAVTFTTSDWSTPQTFTVEALADDNAVNETTPVGHTMSGSDYGLLFTDNPALGTVTVIVNDTDTPRVAVSPTSVTVDEGVTDTYMVELATLPTDEVTVAITSDNTDVTASESTLTFTTGNWDTAQTVTVTAEQDADAANDTATLTHDPSGGDYDSAENTDLEVTVTDDETADITFSPTSVTVDEASTAEYTVVLDTPPVGGNVTVTIVDPTDNGDVTTSPASLVFSASNWDTPKAVTVSAAQDDDTANDTATVTHTVSGADYGSVTVDDVPVTVTDNSVRGITVVPTSRTITEGGAATYTVRLDTVPMGSVTVDISSASSADVTVMPSTLTFTASTWSTAQTVTATAVDDRIDEDAETVDLTHDPSGADYGSVSAVTVTVTVNDNDTRGVSFTPTSRTIAVNEGATAEYTVVLDTQPTGDVTVTPSSGDTTSVTAPGALTFSTTNWETAQAVTVSAIEDGDSTGETVTVSNAVSGGDYGSVTAGDITVNVTDNDTPGVAVSPTSLTVAEGATDTYTVQLNSLPSAQVTVVITTSNTEVTASESTLTFTTSNWNTAQIVTVTAAQDADAANDTATLTHNPGGGDYTSVDDATLTVTVTDDDTRGVTVSESSLEIEEGDSAEYTVVLDTQPEGGSVRIVVASNTGEVTVSPTPLIFTTANWATARTVTVTSTEDFVDEDTETAMVTHTVTGGGYAGETAAPVNVTVNDDDTRGVTVSKSMLEIEEGDRDTYTVVLDSQPTASVEIEVASDTMEVTVSPSSLTFTTGNWRSARTVTVVSTEDRVDEDTETAMVTHTVSGGDYAAETADGVTVTVTDDDTRGLTFIPAMPVTVAEGGTGRYAVRLRSRPTTEVTVGITSDITDVSVNPASLTFTAGNNWSAARTVTITAHEDDIDKDAGVTATLSHDASGGDYGPVSGGVTVSVTDNDMRGVTVSPTSRTVTEGGETTYTVALTSAPTADVMIGVASGNSAEVTVSSPSLTFTDSDWNAAQTVTVVSVEDFVDEDRETEMVTHTVSGGDYGSNNVTAAPVTLRVDDDDTRGVEVSRSSLTVSEGGEDMYTVVLESAPTDSVTVTPESNNGDVTVSAALTFTASNWDTAQAVTVNAAEDNDGVHDSATITHTVIGRRLRNEQRHRSAGVCDRAGQRRAGRAGLAHVVDDRRGRHRHIFSGAEHPAFGRRDRDPQQLGHLGRHGPRRADVHNLELGNRPYGDGDRGTGR